MKEKVLNGFKSKIFPIRNLDKIPTTEPAPEQESKTIVFATPKPTRKQTRKSSSKLYGDFWDKYANDETNIHTEIVQHFY